MNNPNLLPLVEAVEQATGRRPHLSTILRWCTRGTRQGNQIVRLQSRILGGRRLTSVPWVHEYMDATTAASVGGIAESRPTPRQADVAASKAAKQLSRRLGAAS